MCISVYILHITFHLQNLVMVLDKKLDTLLDRVMKVEQKLDRVISGLEHKVHVHEYM
jgi:hypothetical protein